MAITPNTDLYLIKCPIEIDNSNQITFTSKTKQEEYFLSLPHLLVNHISYQRKDGIIRYPEHIDKLYEYNYVMYKNRNYKNKFFYAYITRMEYVNDNMTNIYIKTDTYQTWMFNLEFKKSFIEREHVNDDTIGKHTIPEGLEHGEYIVNDVEYDNYNISDPQDTDKVCYIISTSLNLANIPSGLTDPYDFKFGAIYGGVYSGSTYWGTRAILGAPQKIADINTRGQATAVNGLFIAPKWVVGVFEGEDLDPMSGNVYPSQEPMSVNININRNTVLGSTQLGTYTPKNNKLFTSEYNYLLVNNGAGGTAKYNWENFNNLQATFKMTGVLTPGCSIKLTPNNYFSSGIKDNQALVLGKYPQLNWSTDMYLNWLTQNAVNSAWSIGYSAFNSAAGILSGNLNSISGTVDSAFNLMQEQRSHSYDTPQNSGNLNSGDVTYSGGLNRYQFYKMSIRREYAEIIDNFLSVYGYKVNTLKVPNITGRRNWNYVKTIGINIEAYIPQEDLQEIKNMFNNGITLWHNPNTFLDYSQNNDII